MSTTAKSYFFVLYGINNTGKSTQGKLLARKLTDAGYPAEYFKYAVRNLEPSGSLVDGYLRQGNPHRLSAREFQMIHTLNRTQFQPELEARLAEGISIVAEDYTGTGIAWGIGGGVDKDFLTRLNSHLRQPDLAILLDGDRFLEAVESGHAHETDDRLTARVRQIHLDLAAEYGWIVINANQTIAEVAADIWQAVERRLA